MLFNIDRATKQNILQQYKQDALDYENRKIQERQRKIQEEREFLAQNQKRETEIEDRLRYEKMRKQAEVMEEYKRMLQQKENQSKFSKNGEIRPNQYGFNIPNTSSYKTEPQVLPQNYNNYSNNPNSFQTGPVNQPLNNDNMNNNFELERQLSPSQKEKSLIRREDHMKNFLTDRQNEREIISYFERQKQNRQKYYKEMLDSQCQQNKQSKTMNTTPIQETRNVNIINHYKRFNLANDPYNVNRNFDFGASNLSHNPITNPTNNLDYNKYLNFNVINQGNQTSNQGFNMKPQENQFQQQISMNYNNNNNPYSQSSNNFNNNNSNFNNNYNYQNQMERKNPMDNYNYNMPPPQNNIPQTQYQRNHLPTPSGQTLRQAAASNFLN